MSQTRLYKLRASNSGQLITQGTPCDYFPARGESRQRAVLGSRTHPAPLDGARRGPRGRPEGGCTRSDPGPDHCCLLHSNRLLFGASRSVCWYSWKELSGLAVSPGQSMVVVTDHSRDFPYTILVLPDVNELSLTHWLALFRLWMMEAMNAHLNGSVAT